MHPTVVPARSALVTVTLIGAVACGGSSGPSTPGPTPTTDHISMSQPSATVQVGNQITLSATAIATDGTTQAATFTWATGAASIATVTQQGVVSGVTPGLVDITAKFGGKTGKTAVTVTQPGGVPTGDYTDVSISLATWVTCGRTDVGGARCWGQNSSGQLGDGTMTDRSVPTQVTGTHNYMQVAAGGSQSCGVTAANDVYCWGNLHFGAGQPTTALTPTKVSNGISFAEISIGHTEACGRDTDGNAWCWGTNESGGVGDGTTAERTAPTKVSGGHMFVQVVDGGSFACGRVASGAAYCWGRNDLGEIGDGTTTNRLEPTAVSGGLFFTTIAASLDYACGLTSAGAIWCWGTRFGVVPGTGGVSKVPAQVTSAQAFTELTTGIFHACGITATGAAWCWGDNIKRELGDGSTSSTRSSPVAVTGGITFARIAAGQWYTCGVSLTGAAYCWGMNDFGNLGDGTMAGRTTPTLVH